MTNEEFDPAWDVARDANGAPITITEEQMHAIWRAIQVVEQVRRAEGCQSLWTNPHPNLYKSRLLGRMLLQGRPPTKTKPPHYLGAPEWALLPGGDPFKPLDERNKAVIVPEGDKVKVIDEEGKTIGRQG